MIREFTWLRGLGLLRRAVIALESIAAAQLRAHPPAVRPGRLTKLEVASVEDWNARIAREREGLSGGAEDLG